MVLQVKGSKYYTHLKYFRITDEAVLGIKKIVQFTSFQIYIDFVIGSLLFNLLLFKVVN